LGITAKYALERTIQAKRQVLRKQWSGPITVEMGSGNVSDRFHDFFDMLFRAVLDLLEFLVLFEFSKASFNHVEEFVDVLQKPCKFSTDLSGVQF
jgi:hypothetical protein